MIRTYMKKYKYNAYFADGSDFAKKEYLERIVYDAMSDM